MAFKALNSFHATVYKATSNDVSSPKQKHIDVLLQRINTKDVNLDEISVPLVDKLNSHNWATAYKAIITLHFLIQNGNERFLQNICAKKPNFLSTQRFSHGDHAAIRFLQNHSNYLATKLTVYNNAGFDYCRVRRGANGFLRTINTSRVFEHLTYLRRVIESIVLFNPKENDLRTSLVLTSFSKVFKDLTSLYQFFNEGIMILIECFFELDLQKAKRAFELYKYCLSVSGVIKGIFAEAQEVGIDSSDYNSYSTCRTDMIVTMETHIKTLQPKSPENMLNQPIKSVAPPSPLRSIYKQNNSTAVYHKQQSLPTIITRDKDSSSPESYKSESPPFEKPLLPGKTGSHANLFPVTFDNSYPINNAAKKLTETEPKGAQSNPTSPKFSYKINPTLKQSSVPDLMVGSSLHKDLLELQDFYTGYGVLQTNNNNYSKKNSNPFENGEL